MSDEAATPDAPLAKLPMRENAPGRPIWIARLHADRLELAREGDTTPPTVLRRDELEDRVETIDGLLLLRRMLVVRLDPRAATRTLFFLESGGFERLRAWLGPPGKAELRRSLRMRASPIWTFPVGALWMLVSLPHDGDPKSGTPAADLDGSTFALGALLIAVGLLPRYWPHRGVFLLYAFWFSAFSADCVLAVMHESRGVSAVLAVLGIALAVGGLREYHRFGRV